MLRKSAISRELGLLFEGAKDADFISRELDSADGLSENAHALYVRNNLLEYFLPKYLRDGVPALASGRGRWYVPKPDASLAELQKATQWFVFIGAELTPQLVSLASTSIIFIFEPNKARMDALIEKVDIPLLARKNLFFFSGDPSSMSEPLLHLIPAEVTALGPPVFFIQSGVPEEYATEIRQHVEIVYYHYQLYPYEGHTQEDDKRQLVGGYSYPQTKHLLENLGLLSRSGSVEELRGAGAGGTALLVAAGPALDGQVETIRRLAPHCIIISAGKACSTLVRHGITPDIVILMDARPSCAAELAGLPLGGSILVSYMLAGAKAAECGRILFFGQELEQLGLPDHAIDHLGSVMNYGFYLARIMGCSSIVCAGLQLAAPAPRGAGYGQGLTPKGTAGHTWPCPVRIPGHDTPLYTSLNFLDVSLWLRAEIQKHKLKVINLSRESLLFGNGITYEAEPSVQPDVVQRPLRLLGPVEASQTRELTLQALQKYSEAWSSLCEPERLLKGEGSLAERFKHALSLFDSSGTSHLLKSAPKFRPGWFAGKFFGDNPAERDEAATEYMNILRNTAREFKKIADASITLWRRV